MYRSNYASTLVSQSDWKRHAEALLAAAALVEPRVIEVWRHNSEWLRCREERDPNTEYLYSKPTEVFAIHFMLVAFAIENILKAALVRQNYWQYREEFEKTGQLPKALRKHELFKLAKQIGLHLSDEQEDLLRRLARAATWAGRYPLPVEFQATASGEEFDDGKVWSVSHFFQNDAERVTRLAAEIRTSVGI